MKRILTFIVVISVGLGLISFSAVSLSRETGSKEMPDNVKAAIDKSCFGCHNTDSQNAKSKGKLDLKTLSTLAKTDQIAKLNAITKVIKESEMPPKMFLERFPDKKLTKDEADAISKWAKGEIKSLMKK